jgi:pimeloyl-ACP methyl ester carboxylesterase
MSRLPTDRQVNEFRQLLDASSALPQTAVPVAVGEVDGQSVHLVAHETGTGQSERVLVLVHGIISDSQMWRYLGGDLGKSYDLLAIDLLGCGMSDRPAPPVAAEENYCPKALARGVLLAMRQRLAQRPPGTKVTLVGHSLGGMIILRMYGDPDLHEEFKDILARVDSAVLFTPVDVQITTEPQALKAVAESSDFTFFIADLLGVLRERAAVGTLNSVGDPARAVREEAERVYQILADPSHRHVAQAMLNQAIPHKFVPGRAPEPDWDAIHRIVNGYRVIDVPCLIVWGERDDLFPVSMGYLLATEVPQACLRIVPGARHCIPTEYPRQSAVLIREFLETRHTSPKVARVILSPASTPEPAPVSTPVLAGGAVSVKSSADKH